MKVSRKATEKGVRRVFVSGDFFGFSFCKQIQFYVTVLNFLVFMLNKHTPDKTMHQPATLVLVTSLLTPSCTEEL